MSNLRYLDLNDALALVSITLFTATILLYCAIVSDHLN